MKTIITIATILMSSSVFGLSLEKGPITGCLKKKIEPQELIAHMSEYEKLPTFDDDYAKNVTPLKVDLVKSSAAGNFSNLDTTSPRDSSVKSRHWMKFRYIAGNATKAADYPRVTIECDIVDKTENSTRFIIQHCRKRADQRSRPEETFPYGIKDYESKLIAGITNANSCAVELSYEMAVDLNVLELGGVLANLSTIIAAASQPKESFRNYAKLTFEKWVTKSLGGTIK